MISFALINVKLRRRREFYKTARERVQNYFKETKQVISYKYVQKKLKCVPFLSNICIYLQYTFILSISTG